MKPQFYLLFTTFLLTSCLHNAESRYKISPILNREIFIDNKSDSLKIDSLNKRSVEFEEKCKREKLDCTNDPHELYAEFFGGIYKFRELLFKKFKPNRKSICGENKIRITIGNQNNLEKVEIIKFTDANTKKYILEILKSEEFQKWESAKLYGIKVKEQIEFSIEIVRR